MRTRTVLIVILVLLGLSCSNAFCATTAPTVWDNDDISGMFKRAEGQWREGKRAEARELYSRIAKLPTVSNLYKVCALRMVAQISHNDLGDVRSAERSAEEILKLADQMDSNPRVRFARAQAMNLLATIETDRGNTESSIRLWTRFLAESANYPDGHVIESAYIQIARAHHAMGRYKQAVTAYDECLTKCPKIKDSIDRYLALMHERVSAHGFSWNSDEHIRLMRELWALETFHGRVGWFNIGRELVSSLYSAGRYTEVVQVASELRISLGKTSKDDVSRAGRDILDTAHSECLWHLASALSQLKTTRGAIETYTELVRLFPKSPTGLAAGQELTILREKYNSEMGQQVDDILPHSSSARQDESKATTRIVTNHGVETNNSTPFTDVSPDNGTSILGKISVVTVVLAGLSVLVSWCRKWLRRPS